MKRSLLTITFLLAAFLPFCAKCQSVERLFKKLDSVSSDSARSDIYYSISTRYWNGNSDSVLSMAREALAAARKGDYEKGVALALLSEGVGHELKEEYPESLECYLQALRISEMLHLDGLKENIYVDLGNVYAHLKNYSRGTRYYLSALRITEKYPDRRSTAILLINLAETYKETASYDSALAYNHRAWDIVRDIHDSALMSTVLLNIGDNYNRRGQPDSALIYLRQCSQLAIRIDDVQDHTWSCISIAQSLLLQRKYDESVEEARTALENAQRLSLSEITELCYSVLYRDYLQWGKFEKALHFRNLEIAWKDSLTTIERDKKIRTLQAEYELEKKQHDIDVLNKDNLLQQKELVAARWRYIIITACALFFGMSAIFLYRSNKEKESLNRLLQAQTKRKNAYGSEDDNT